MSFLFPTVFLALAGLFLLLSLGLLWWSFAAPQIEAPLDLDEALAVARPTVAEEQKLAILRSLKDLEYERTVGKISEADYRVVAAEFSAQAKEAIASADASLQAGRAVAHGWIEAAKKESSEGSAQ